MVLCILLWDVICVTNCMTIIDQVSKDKTLLNNNRILNWLFGLKSDKYKLQVHFLGFLNNVNYKYYIIHRVYNYSMLHGIYQKLLSHFMCSLLVYFLKVHPPLLRTHILIKERACGRTIILYLHIDLVRKEL